MMNTDIRGAYANYKSVKRKQNSDFMQKKYFYGYVSLKYFLLIFYSVIRSIDNFNIFTYLEYVLLITNSNKEIGFCNISLK